MREWLFVETGCGKDREAFIWPPRLTQSVPRCWMPSSSRCSCRSKIAARAHCHCQTRRCWARLNTPDSCTSCCRCYWSCGSRSGATTMPRIDLASKLSNKKKNLKLYLNAAAEFCQIFTVECVCVTIVVADFAVVVAGRCGQCKMMRIAAHRVPLLQ